MTTTGWSSAPVPCFSWTALLAIPATSPAESGFIVPWAGEGEEEEMEAGMEDTFSTFSSFAAPVSGLQRIPMVLKLSTC